MASTRIRLLAMCALLFVSASAFSDTTAPAGLISDRMLLSGQGGLAYFDSGADGNFPNHEFRIDEARLFLDVRLHTRAFLFTELVLTEREVDNPDARVGELYVDIEEVSRLWGQAYPLTLRVGRFAIPYGEEYLTRYAFDNPFISHSLADPWGFDEGVALFGKHGRMDYIVAAQNGGYLSLRDGDPDKSATVRIGWNPDDRTRISASAMRTGNISVQSDIIAEMWFGNAYIAPIGKPETTTTFWAELAEIAARRAWNSGHVAGAVGAIRYDDNDSAADNASDAVYYSAEVVQNLSKKAYGAARFSAIRPDDVYPVLGQHAFAEDADLLVEDIWRATLAIGYRFSDNVLIKAEYSMERGKDAAGKSFDQQDQVSAEVAFRF